MAEALCMCAASRSEHRAVARGTVRLACGFVRPAE